jgi:hypothetical protein
VNYYGRPERFDVEWPYDGLLSVDVVPLTPAAFDRRSREEYDLARTAIETGVVLEVPKARWTSANTFLPISGRMHVP